MLGKLAYVAPAGKSLPTWRAIASRNAGGNVDGDEMTIEASSQFFDTNGTPLVAACARGTGTRFEDVGDED